MENEQDNFKYLHYGLATLKGNTFDVEYVKGRIEDLKAENKKLKFIFNEATEVMSEISGDENGYGDPDLAVDFNEKYEAFRLEINKP